MSESAAAAILSLIIFACFAYVIHMRVRKGRWPKLRNPFYFPE